MYLRTKTRQLLEKSLGRTVDELSNMDFSEELAFLKTSFGKSPTFPKKVDYRMVGRGNRSIVQRNFMTMNDVDNEIMGWKKDERYSRKNQS